MHQSEEEEDVQHIDKPLDGVKEIEYKDINTDFENSGCKYTAVITDYYPNIHINTNNEQKESNSNRK